MARRIKYTEEKIAKLSKEGRGNGEGADYIPWLMVGEFSSKGRGHRIKDHVNGRIHHFFSDLEANYYYILAWADNVIDIREQFPLLPRSMTEQISEELEYLHPRCPGSDINLVMTTDFLLTVRDDNGYHYEARSVKYSSELMNARTQEKIEIEAKYWETKGIRLKIVTENSVDRTKAENIKRILSYYNQNENPDVIVNSSELFKLFLKNDYSTINDIWTILEREFDLKDGTGSNFFFYLCSHKMIPINIAVQIIGTSKIADIVDWSRWERMEGEINNAHSA